ncbi:MAG: hypothetical protein A2283_22430 [Lentisphaerae bacterium RIFOXYA12_FULL_48_11]|nr:MAG: hypothetical protein A2283_22430 [Lentisphaerae bacterium RIFOXYA12_FULL_48_11]
MYIRWRETANIRGSILVMTVWVLFFLATLAVAVGGLVASNVRAAAGIKNRVKAYYLARAGIEMAITETKSDSNAWDSINEPWGSSEELFREVSIGEDKGNFSVYYDSVSTLGGSVTNYGMYDEERKININKASLAMLKAMMENIAQVDSMTASDVASAIVDWRDVDDVVLTGGAENSYYAALSEPYSCHNGDFQSLHELRLIKGLTAVIFEKIKPYITMFGTGKININTADLMVLVCAAEAGGGGDRTACRLLVDKIGRFRASGNAFVDPSILSRLNAFVETTPIEKTILARMMGNLTIRSSCFGGIAGGRVPGSIMDDRRIEFVFDRQQGVKLYWHEF